MSATCAEREPPILRALASHAYARALTLASTSASNSKSGLLIESPCDKNELDPGIGYAKRFDGTSHTIDMCIYSIHTYEINSLDLHISKRFVSIYLTTCAVLLLVV